MIFLLVAYFLAVLLAIFILNRKKQRFFSIPRLKVSSVGLIFYSLSRHRLNIFDASMMQIGNIIYLKKDNKLILIKNVDSVMRTDNFIYFTALGEVKIVMNTKEIYRYFNIQISTPNVDFDYLKYRASRGILNNIFEFEKCKYLKDYIQFIKMLNIVLKNDKLIVHSNRMHIPFVLTYKLNNKIKKVNINDRL